MPRTALSIPIDATLNRVSGPAWVAAVAPVVLAVSALLVWALSLRGVDLRGMNDLGLVSVLPASFFLALAILTVGFALSLRRPRPSRPVVLLHVGALILMLYGVTSIVEDVARIDVTWRHVGVAEYIARTGEVNPRIDAYFNWPGFFILLAFVTELAGLRDATALTAWAPVFFNLLYLGPLLVLLKTATFDDRLVWLAVWLFYLTNWIGQDYLAPQALSYFLYLVILAVLLRWFRATAEGEPDPKVRMSGLLRRILGALSRLGLRARRRLAVQPVRPPAPELGRRERAALIGIVVALSAAIVASHQLTPFVLVLGVGILVASGLCTARGLPLVTVVLVGAWLSFPAITYMAGHLENVVGGVGAVGESVEANVQERVQGSDEHLAVVRLRLLMTAAVWALALVGAIVAWRRGLRAMTFAILAIAPFLLTPLQPYGGEMLLRAYLFSLPFVVFFAASLFFPTLGSGRTWLTPTAVAVVSLGFAGAFLVARYGNERMDYFTTGEVEAVRHLYGIAPPGSLLLSASGNVPWKFEGYEKYDYGAITETTAWEQAAAPTPTSPAVVGAVRGLLASRGPGRAYLIMTRSDKAHAELLGLAAPGSFERLESRLLRSPRVQLIHSTGDARIFAASDRARAASSDRARSAGSSDTRATRARMNVGTSERRS